MAPAKNSRVDPSLQYRWGIVGIVLAVGLSIWFAKTSGIIKNQSETIENNNVRILCPRCGGDPQRQPNCSLCHGTGFIWVDKTKYLPEEITPLP